MHGCVCVCLRTHIYIHSCRICLWFYLHSFIYIYIYFYLILILYALYYTCRWIEGVRICMVITLYGVVIMLCHHFNPERRVIIIYIYILNSKICFFSLHFQFLLMLLFNKPLGKKIPSWS